MIRIQVLDGFANGVAVSLSLSVSGYSSLNLQLNLVVQICCDVSIHSNTVL